PRQPHPVPTRRSSDLGTPERRGQIPPPSRPTRRQRDCGASRAPKETRQSFHQPQVGHFLGNPPEGVFELSGVVCLESAPWIRARSEEHTSELQSRENL